MEQHSHNPLAQRAVGFVHSAIMSCIWKMILPSLY